MKTYSEGAIGMQKTGFLGSTPLTLRCQVKTAATQLGVQTTHQEPDIYA